MGTSKDPGVMVGHAEAESERALVRSLLDEYADWVLSVAEDAETAQPLLGLRAEAADLPGLYAPPDGRILLATYLGEPAGIVCLRRADETSGEVKRLYVSPRQRGRGIGRRLVEKLIEEARNCGYRRLVLNSHHSMTSAHAVYEAAGFTRVAPFDGFPEELIPVAVFMEMEI